MNSIFCVHTGPGAQPGVQVCTKQTAHFCLRTVSFGPTHDQEPSQGSRSVLQTAHFCLRTASFWVHTGPGAQAGVQVCTKIKKQLISAWEHLLLGPHKARSPAKGSRSVQKKAAHFRLKNSIFWVHTGPGAQPVVQVCTENGSFLLENSMFCVPTRPGAQARVQVCIKKK